MILRLTVLLLTISTAAFAQQATFIKNSVATRAYELGDINYLVHLPKEDTKKEKKPLLLFIHGSNQTGGDINKITSLGPLSLVKDDGALPFIVVAPHLPYKLASKWPTQLIYDVLQDALKKYPIDETRIYITGVSKGAAGVWAYCSEYPETVTAAMPIAGYGNKDKVCNMKNVPVWAFHGENDKYIHVKSSRDLVQGLKRCGGDVLYTEYPNGNHDIWVETYRNPVVFDWMMNFKKGQAPLKPSADFIKSNLKTKASKSYKLPAALHEISGMVRCKNGDLWAHNDSGNNPAIFKFDSTGQVLQYVKIMGAANKDWEDMTLDTAGNLYIGDIGNNSNDRKSFQIYKLDSSYQEATRIFAKRINFTLPDQQDFPPKPSELNFDFEALIWFKGNLYLFSKNRTIPFNGLCNIYKIPDQPGDHVAEFIGSLQLGNENMVESWVTAADYHRTTGQLALLSSNKMWLINQFDADHFHTGNIKTIEFNHFSQKEAISFHSNDQFWIADETFMKISGGYLYFIQISK